MTRLAKNPSFGWMVPIVTRDVTRCDSPRTQRHRLDPLIASLVLEYPLFLE